MLQFIAIVATRLLFHLVHPEIREGDIGSMQPPPMFGQPMGSPFFTGHDPMMGMIPVGPYGEIS